MTPQDVFDQIEQELGAGMVPRIFRLLESRPTLLIHLWGQFRAIVLEGELPRVLKEMVGLVIASITHCAYVRVVHLHSLSLQGVDADLLQSLRAGDFQLSGVSNLTEQALRFTVMSASTRSAYGDPHVWPGMRQASLELLATMALEDSEKIELVATIALFEQVCSVANLLDLDPNQP
ncbi:MAG: carboxymuconolactone decarboxylase family protein [Cyanophyceae cyanobacterium]